MRIQVVQDSKGKAAGVFIPIHEWEQLKKQYKDLEALESIDLSSKEALLEELKEAIKELKQIEKGKLKARPAKELLNEL